MFQLNVTIQANSTADIYLPFWSKSQQVAMDGAEVPVRGDGNYVIVENAGSGSHTFDVRP